MRLDVFLKKTCLVKTRNQAKEFCEKGNVLLNGRNAKPSKEIKEGDIIIYRNKSIEVLKIPTGNVSKKEAGEYYRMLKKGD